MTTDFSRRQLLSTAGAGIALAGCARLTTSDAPSQTAAIPDSGFSTPTRTWLASGRHVNVDGHRVFTYERGRGPSIVFIHGFPTSGFDWRDTIAKLSDDFHCIAFDQLAYGLSDKPRRWSYSLFQQADILEGLLKNLGVNAAHVVSHDVGTSLHTELLARQAEGTLSFTMRAATFLNGSMIKSMASLTEFQKNMEVPSRIPEARKLLAQMLPGYVDSLKQLMARPERLSAADETVMREIMAYQDGHLNIPSVYSYVRERYIHTDTWLDAISKTRVPIQIVWAAADPVAVVAMGRALAGKVPQAKYSELSGVGHFTPIEAPDEVALAIRRMEHAQG